MEINPDEIAKILRERIEGLDTEGAELAEVGHVGERQPDEGQGGEDEGDEQLLAVPEDRRGLEAGLGEPPPARGRRPGRRRGSRRRAHRRPPAVRAK